MFEENIDVGCLHAQQVLVDLGSVFDQQLLIEQLLTSCVFVYASDDLRYRDRK